MIRPDSLLGILWRHRYEPVFNKVTRQQRHAQFATFRKQWQQYCAMPDAENAPVDALHPCLDDQTPKAPFDAHYTYQSLWAAEAIRDSQVPEHVDVGSLVLFVTMLSAITRVIEIDIRPLEIDAQNIESRAGSLLELPFEDQTVQSISSLHVIEHVGLGRYGDPLDPNGTRRSAAELARVLAPGGSLYVSLPVGKPRVCFNAHRIHDPVNVPAMFPGLTLKQFQAVDDQSTLRKDVTPEDMRSAAYACGMYRFTR